MQGNTQNLTLPEVKTLLQKMKDKQMLAESGEKYVLERIDYANRELTGVFENGIPMHSLLSLFGVAFQESMYLRMGFHLFKDNQLKRKRRSEDKEDVPKQPTKKEQKKMIKAYKELEKKYPYLAVERNLPVEDKDFQESFVFYGFGQGVAKEDYIHPKRSTIGKTRTRTAQELLAMGIISSEVYAKIKEGIDNKEIMTEAGVFGTASEWTKYYAEYTENKAKQITYLQKLQEKGIITAQNVQKIVASYEKNKLKDLHEILPHCEKSVVVDMREYGLYLKEAYSKLLAEAKKIVPQMGYKNLQITFEKKQEYSKEMHTVYTHIQFEVAGKIYRHKFYQGLEWIDKHKEDSVAKLQKIVRASRDFVTVINKFLSDTEAKERVHFHEFYLDKKGNTYPNGGEKVGLILLTEAQAKEEKEEQVLFNLVEREVSYDNRFSPTQIGKLIEEYEKIGLFSHLTMEEIATGKAEAQAKNPTSFVDILLCFPKNVVYFDWETGNLENPYEDLTKQFGEITRGQFIPQNIKDSFFQDLENRNRTTLYSFEFKDKYYEAHLKISSDWLDPTFLALIEKAMEEHQVVGKLYDCLDNGQAQGYIFLTPVQYEYLKKNQPDLFPER